MTEPIGTARARRRRARRRRLTAIGAGVVVVAAGGTAALAATDDSTPDAVTAKVTTGSVQQTVEASGTISSPKQTDAAFSASGTVDTVKVATGDKVTKGQVLATLDTTSLQGAVDSAQGTVATAQQKLEDDKTGQTSSSSGSGGSGSSGQLATESADATPLAGTATFTAASTAAASDQSQLIAQIKAAQQKLITAQQAVDKDQDAVDAAQQVIDADVKQNADLRDAQAKACADTGSTDPTDPPSDGTDSTAPASDSDDNADSDSDACTSAQADYQAFADTLTADTAKLDAAITAQDGAIDDLDTAIGDLDDLLAQLQAQPDSSPGSGTTPGAGSGNSGTGGTGSGSTGKTGTGKTGTGKTGTGKTGTGKTGTAPTQGSGTGNRGTGGTGSSRSSGSSLPSGTSTGTSSGSSTKVASASQLAADQAAIDAAEADLKVAEQDLAAATLKSPIAGTVATVGLTAGSSSRGSSITILGTGNQVVGIAVPLSQIDQVKVGQPASLQVDGLTAPVSGKVTRIGLLSSTSGSLTTFPVTITLADGSPSVHDGVGADVTVTTGSADNAILVPNSAITSLGTRHTVTVVKDGKAQTTVITLGLVGPDSSQVTKGLSAGDTVQLADPGQDLPASTTSSTNSRIRVGGGSGAFPGGFGGGGTRGGR